MALCFDKNKFKKELILTELENQFTGMGKMKEKLEKDKASILPENDCVVIIQKFLVCVTRF